MKMRLLFLLPVMAAIIVVLWFKPNTSTVPVDLVPTAQTTVLLFADPREAQESCGCAEIINSVRDLKEISNIQLREIDSRNAGEAARLHHVRTSPTVIVLDAAGNEKERFEGESSATLKALRLQLAALKKAPGASKENAKP